MILIDTITHVGFGNGLLRIECARIGADNQPHDSGTIIIPGNRAGAVLNALIKATKELEEKHREQMAKEGRAGNA